MFRRKDKNKDMQEDTNKKKGDEENPENNEQDALGKCKEQLNDTKGKLLRVSADLQNFKKRVEKEKIQWLHIAQAEIIVDLLNIVDDFDRAMVEYEKKEIPKESQVFLDGFVMISKSFYKLLEKYNVQEITENKLFDPTLHEAISQIESPDHKTDEIVDVIQKGFICKGKILRPAKVVVAK